MTSLFLTTFTPERQKFCLSAREDVIILGDFVEIVE